MAKQLHVAVMEALGTGMLLLTIQMVVASGSTSAPLIIGISLAIAVYIAAPISGGHLNPAVTLALWLRGGVDLDTALTCYVPAQLFGGTLGAALGAMLTGQAIAPAVGSSHNLMSALLAELTFTALLCLVVLVTATHSGVAKNQYFGAAIGLTVTVGAACAGGISGGCFNPAVALGLTGVKHFWHPIYALLVSAANLLGAIAGSFLFYIVAPDEFGNSDEIMASKAEEGRALLADP